MKKLLSLSFIICLCLALSACCVRHDWAAGDCSHEGYCLNCGERNGVKGDHNWIEADCTNPRRCTVCGYFEGAALGHDSEKGICFVCGETLYSDWSDFEEYGIITDLQADTLYAFTTGTKYEPGTTTAGEIILGGFGPIGNDESHPAREGYEWHYVIINAVFFDENARKNGVAVKALCEDYYNILLRGSTERSEENGLKAYSVMVDGEEKEVRYRRSSNWSGWYKSESRRRENLYTVVWEIERPVGYDGVVVGLCSSLVDWPQGQYINQVYSQQDFFLFRLG